MLISTVRPQDDPTILSSVHRSYPAPIPEEGSEPVSIQPDTEKADISKQKYELEIVEKPTSGLDNECGTHEPFPLDKEAKSNESGTNECMVA